MVSSGSIRKGVARSVLAVKVWCGEFRYGVYGQGGHVAPRLVRVSRGEAGRGGHVTAGSEEVWRGWLRRVSHGGHG